MIVPSLRGMDVPGCSCVKAGLKETCNARGGCVMQGVAVMVGGVDVQCPCSEVVVSRCRWLR